MFFAFLAKVDHYLPAWQLKKKSVRGNILDANVLNYSDTFANVSSLESADLRYLRTSLFHKTNERGSANK